MGVDGSDEAHMKRLMEKKEDLEFKTLQAVNR